MCRVTLAGEWMDKFGNEGMVALLLGEDVEEVY